MKLLASSSNLDLPAHTLGERLYAQIKQLIFDFELLPGERFSESELANRMQLSRTPLRHALQRLQREGYLRVFPKSGWQVAELDFVAFDQLYALRLLLETHAVTRLCELEARPGLAELAETWLVPPAERHTACLAVDRLDEVFHSALVQAAGNPEMLRVHDDITERIRLIRRLDFVKPARIEATYEEHAAIVRAITLRRADEAQRLLRAHVQHSQLEARHITQDLLWQARERFARNPGGV